MTTFQNCFYHEIARLNSISISLSCPASPQYYREYGAGWDEVGEGTLLTTYLPSDGSPPFVVDKRDLTDKNNVVVVYHNPYDNVVELAHIFFQRCLEHKVTPYIVTKKTVFKWQEGFWTTMKDVFDKEYKVCK